MSPRGRRGDAPLVVLGDALLDIDLVGRADRVAPDAPVPVLDALVETSRPGGAALAATLAAAADRPVVLVTALADDEDGERLAAEIRGRGVELVVVPQDGTTSVKRRVRAGGQSIVRLDTGEPGAAGPLPRALARVLAEAGGILVSDYGRGLADHPGVRALLTAAAREMPLVWDPHPRGAAPVAGATLVTPNAAEACHFAGEPTSHPSIAEASRCAAALVERWRAHGVAVTLGEHGALLSRGPGAPVVLPVPGAGSGTGVQAVDVCGAGDRFAASALAELADGALPVEAVEMAVAAASDFVASGGAASLARPALAAGDPCDPGDPERVVLGEMPAEPETPVALARRLRAATGGGTLVATGGCFDLLHAGHVAALTAARALGDALVVCVNSDASVARLKGAGRPLVPAHDRVRVLEALRMVDAVVVFEEDTPVPLLEQLRPDLWVKGGDYTGAELPEAATVAAWGGEVVVVPYLSGRSTTGLVRTAAGID